MTTPHVIRVEHRDEAELVPLVRLADEVLLELADRLGAHVLETAQGRPAVSRTVADAILRGLTKPEVRA